MASSGRRVALAAAALFTVAAVAAGCSGSETEIETPQIAATEASTTPAPEVAVGPPITAESSEYFLPLYNEGRQVQPVAEYEGRILVAESTMSEGDEARQRFVLWNPESGAREPLWESEPGKQDVVTASEDGTAVVVRMGLALPFPDWSIFIADLSSGALDEIATADPAVAEAQGIQPSPPFGFAPYPALSEGRIVWVQHRVEDSGVVREVVLYDLQSGEERVLADVDARAGGDLASPAIGGDRAAWVEREADGDSRIVTYDIAAGSAVEVAPDAAPYAVAISRSGDVLAWDDARGGKYMLPDGSDEPTRFAGDEGWGITASGERFSWAPAPAYGGTGGYFDLGTDSLRLVEQTRGTLVNYTVLLDDWFGWQQLVLTPAGTPDPERSGYHFMPFDGAGG